MVVLSTARKGISGKLSRKSAEKSLNPKNITHRKIYSAKLYLGRPTGKFKSEFFNGICQERTPKVAIQFNSRHDAVMKLFFLQLC